MRGERVAKGGGGSRARRRSGGEWEVRCTTTGREGQKFREVGIGGTSLVGTGEVRGKRGEGVIQLGGVKGPRRNYLDCGRKGGEKRKTAEGKEEKNGLQNSGGKTREGENADWKKEKRNLKTT